MPGILGKFTRSGGETREIIHDGLTSLRPVPTRARRQDE
jgi:hypothetical protein